MPTEQDANFAPKILGKLQRTHDAVALLRAVMSQLLKQSKQLSYADTTDANVVKSAAKVALEEQCKADSDKCTVAV